MPEATVIEDRYLFALMSKAVGMQSFGRLVSIAYLLSQCERVNGDVCEFGVYRGDTAKVLSALTKKKVWLYDSFAGNPEPTPEDNLGPDCASHHQKGGNAADVSVVKLSIADAIVRTDGSSNQVNVVNKFFSEITPDELPDSIAFAHFDCNLYESTLEALKLAVPRMSRGAFGVIDDYHHPELPGVAKAVLAYGLSSVDVYEPGGERAAHVWFFKGQ